MAVRLEILQNAQFPRKFRKKLGELRVALAEGAPDFQPRALDEVFALIEKRFDDRLSVRAESGRRDGKFVFDEGTYAFFDVTGSEGREHVRASGGRLSRNARTEFVRSVRAL